MKTNKKISKITKAQYNELLDYELFYGIKEFHKLLKEYTGIKVTFHVVACFTVYDYKDANGTFIGNTDDLDTLLQSAHIFVAK